MSNKIYAQLLFTFTNSTFRICETIKYILITDVNVKIKCYLNVFIYLLKVNVSTYIQVYFVTK